MTFRRTGSVSKLYPEALRRFQPFQVIRLKRLRYLAVLLIQFAVGGFVCLVETIFHGYGYGNVPAGCVCRVHVLGFGIAVAINKDCEQQKPGAGKSDHACTITEPSAGLVCTEDEVGVVRRALCCGCWSLPATHPMLRFSLYQAGLAGSPAIRIQRHPAIQLA